MNNKKIFLLIIAIATQISLFAKQNVLTEVKEDSFMRSEGKIYVVMTVALTILLGLLMYIWRLDKKISKLEK